MLSYCISGSIQAHGIAGVAGAYRFVGAVVDNLGDCGHCGGPAFPTWLPRRFGPATRHGDEQCV